MRFFNKSISLKAAVFRLFFLFVVSEVNYSAGENILVLVAVSSKSHKNVFEPIVSALAERNHTITLVSAHPPLKERKNVREIQAYDFRKMDVLATNPLEKRAAGPLKMLKGGGMNLLFEACHDVYNHNEFKGLGDQQFDLIFVDGMKQECFMGLVYKLGTPFIIVSTLPAPSTISVYVGNRFPPSFVPFFMLDSSDDMTFMQRVVNIIFTSVVETSWEYILYPKAEAIYRQYLGEDLPAMTEIYKNVSMIFSNSHFSLNIKRPLLPDIVEIGGIICKPPKPLPANLEDFMSGAGRGVILFSLGSIVRASELPEATRKVFLNVFSRLKQRVVWKWEIDNMEDLPPNVKLSKWIPQQDVLRHPNMRLFITHCGLLSVQESIFYGVPVLGIPMFGDQDVNANRAEQAGYGLKIEILTVTEDILEHTINRLLDEEQFSNRAKELSKLLQDQSETPLERAVYWSEYVMRHKGAKHLRSSARDLNFVQYYSIDVLAFLFLIVLVNLWIAKVMLVNVFAKFCIRKKSVQAVNSCKKNE